MKTFLSGLLFLFVLAACPAHGQTYNCKITSQKEVSVSSISTKYFSQNAVRRCLLIQMHGSSTVYIKFNSAHTGTEGRFISNDAFWEPIVVPTGPVYLKSSAGIITTEVYEGQ